MSKTSTDENAETAPWSGPRAEVKKEPQLAAKWDALIRAFDHFIATTPALSIPLAYKKEIHDSYADLVHKYPYSSAYWRAWLVSEYKLTGTQSSIDVLCNAVQKFPHSIDLWRDYLSALITQYDSNPTTNALEAIRRQYRYALDCNGLHFNGHVLWDVILAFETRISSNSAELLSLYLELISVPCYQYAQYLSKFAELKSGFEIQDILEALKKRPEILARYNIESPDKTIDEFILGVSHQTYLLVTEKWEHESLLLHPAFTPQLSQEVKDELSAWLNYLKHEMEKCRREPTSRFQFDLTVNLFERALVPYCWYSKVWKMYVAFLNATNQATGVDIVDLMTAVYERANALLPLSQIEVRLSFCGFLLKHQKKEDAIDYLLNLIKTLIHVSPVLREQACSVLEFLLRLWEKTLLLNGFIGLCESILEEQLNDTQDRPAKRHHGEQVSTGVAYVKIKETLQVMLAAPLAVTYLRALQQHQPRGFAEKIRNFYNQHHQHQALATSPAFFKFFVDFEGIVCPTPQNLSAVSRYISFHSQLPKAAVDDLTEHVYDIVAANLLLFAKATRKEILWTKYNEMSNSLSQNKAAVSRLGTNSCSIKEELKDLRPTQALRMATKQAGHVGQVVDNVPTLTNPQHEHVLYADKNVEPLPLPTFKNVERANAPPKLVD